MSDTNPTTLNCPACGAPLDFDGTSTVVRCKFCGNVSLLPGALPNHAATSASALDDIRQLVWSGNIVEALQKYRETYGVDLQEAKDAVDALQAGRLVTPSAVGMRSPEELTKALQEVQRLLSAGDKIEAIKIYRQNYDVSLARAKYAIDQIEAGQTAFPETGLRRAEVQVQKTPTSRAGKWLALIISMAVILIVGGVVALVLLQPGGPLTPHYLPGSKAVLIPSKKNILPDIAVWLYDSGADNRFIGLVNGASGKLSWHAAPLAGDGYVDALVASPDLVYVASGTDLLVYRKSDGYLIWRAQMPDKLNYGPSTLLVRAVRVITNNVDQSIQAYDAASGRPIWNKLLVGYDRSLRIVGDSLVVVDYTDNNYNYGLIFIDPVTGSQQRVINPTCTYNDYESSIDPDAGLVYDQTEAALFLVYGSSYGCVQRIDLNSGQTTWSSNSKDSFNFSPDGFQSLMTDSTLYFSNGNEILAVNKSTGEMKVLLTNPDYDLLPLAMTGDKLIVRARRTRGTEKFELWGVNAATGESVWQMDMQAAKPIDPPDEISGLIDNTDWGWTWKLVPGGLVVIKFEGKPNQIVFETFNPATGASLGKQTLPLNNISGDFYEIPTIIGSQDNIVYFTLESNIYSLDLTAGKLKRVY